jgi:hypothetical protein
MRVVVILIAGGLLLVEFGGSAKLSPETAVVSAAAESTVSAESTASAPKPRVDFDTQLKPIFQAKCMPCHFSGGKMYDRLPFDKPATIKKLGVKLFTRINDERERRLIEDFLTQEP